MFKHVTDKIRHHMLRIFVFWKYQLHLVVVNELWRVRASVTTVTFELAIDGFGDKRLGGVNVQ
jgi:hypothetical protein